MSVAAYLLLLAGMGAVTYLSRRAFLRLPGKVFSDRMKNALTYIPVGIFAGLVFPSLFIKDGNFAVQPLYLAASVICLVVMALTRNVFASFGISLLFVVLASAGILPFPLG